MYKLNKTGVKMTNFVKIKHGTYRKNTIENMVFPVLKPLNIGKKGAFITVNGSEVLGDKFDKIRVLIEDPTKDSISTPSSSKICEAGINPLIPL